MKFLYKTKTIVWVCFLLVFVLLAGAGTYAWMSINRDADNSGVEMQPDGGALRGLPMTVYWKYIDDDDELVYTKSDDNRIILPTYDSVFTELNKDARVFVRVPVLGETIKNGDPFTIDLSLLNKDDTDGTDTIFSSNKNLYEDPNASTKIAKLLLSNVINIKCGLIGDLNDAEDSLDNAETIVKANETFFGGTSGISSDKFLAVSGGRPTKKTSISFTVSDYASARSVISDDGVENYLLYLYFEISYDPDLVRFVLEARDLELGSEEVKVDSDLDRFVLN